MENTEAMEHPEIAPDLLGRTSARLLAAGIGRRARLDALHLLAVLDASTDATGVVRRPLDDLAAEFELEPLSVIVALDHLERAGAVQRVGDHVALARHEGDTVGGMQLAGFLDDVRASFDGGHGTPAPRRARRVARAGVALVAAAAAIAVVTIAPSNPPAADTPLAVATSTTATPASSSSTAPPTAVAPTTTQAQVPVPTADAVPAAPLPAPETTVAAASCPTGSPVAEVIDGIIRITNPTDEDVVVEAGAIDGVILTEAVVVSAGTSVIRPAPGALLIPAHALTDGWAWHDATVARTCPA